MKRSSVRLSLSDGDWVDIKQQLNVGEDRERWSIAGASLSQGESVLEDPLEFIVATLATYILGWSFLGLDSQPIRWPKDGSIKQRMAAVDALDTDSKDELYEALNAHLEATKAEKKEQPGETAPAAISPSAA